ncbi:hypothetical protein SY88_01200 [Clostridiales bacterium PH28_bin88]|nr:hypothetical protein SY88_01200 [Clostridiales bacterium PH28_bin88]
MTRRSIRYLAYLTLAGFLVLILNLTYLQVIQRATLTSHPANPRSWLREQQVLRGEIYDRNGKALAVNQQKAANRTRFYPLGPAAAHVVGFEHRTVGRVGLEEAYNEELLGSTGVRGWLNAGRRLAGVKPVGNDLFLTLDADLQRLAYQQLQGRRGAVVLVVVDTGAILVMASSPAYDPNWLEEQWDEASSDGNAPLLNRATQGLYPPGSVMKVITGAAALRVDPGNFRLTFDCPGYIEVDGRWLACTRPHGRVDMVQAIMYSCNVFFARLALEMGGEALSRGAAAFGFMRGLPFDLPVQPPRFPAGELLDSNQLVETAIGQGKVLVTPLQVAVMVATVANSGVMLRPYLVREVRDSKGRVVYRHRKEILGVAASTQTAEMLKDAMVEAVAQGTGQMAAVPGVTVAGKTGSAENPHGEPHAWFAGFAPAAQPQVAVAVVIENGGQGGRTAAPVAQAMLAAALRVRR